jgi:hypothetical protein
LLVAGLTLSICGFGAAATFPGNAEATGASSSFVAVNYARLLDTRTSGFGALSAGEERTLQVLGVGGIPPAGVEAVVIDVTALSSTSATGAQLTAWKTGTTRPAAQVRFSTSTVPLANTVIVEPSATGLISLHNTAGSTELNVDVQAISQQARPAVM